MSQQENQKSAAEWQLPIEIHGWIRVWSWEELNKLVTTEEYTIPGVARIEKNKSGFLNAYCDISGLHLGFMKFSDSIAADVGGRPFIIPNWVLDAFRVKDKPLPDRVKNHECEKLRAEVDDLSKKVQKLMTKVGE